MLVRKSTEHAHSFYTFEGYYGGGSYIIIDDVIDSGETIRRIHGAAKGSNADQPFELVGIFLYHPFKAFERIDSLDYTNRNIPATKVWDCRAFMPDEESIVPGLSKVDAAKIGTRT